MLQVYSAVKALIKNKNKFLILEVEFEGKQYIDLPGGKIKYGESPYDTLIREVKEETCLDIEIIKPIGIWWFFRIFDKHQVICNTFLCTTQNINIDINKNPANEKIINYHWLEKEELLNLKNLLNDSLNQLFKSL